MVKNKMYDIIFICPHCSSQTEDTVGGILRDGFLLECSKCLQITVVRFDTGSPSTEQRSKPGACRYPDWQGSLEVGNHSFDKDGYCAVCGVYSPIK